MVKGLIHVTSFTNADHFMYPYFENILSDIK